MKNKKSFWVVVIMFACGIGLPAFSHAEDRVITLSSSDGSDTIGVKNSAGLTLMSILSDGKVGMGNTATTSTLRIDGSDNQLLITTPETNYGVALVYNTVAPFTTNTAKGALTFQRRNNNGEWTAESVVLSSLDMDNGFLSAHGFLYFSDECLKENIREIPDALERIKKLRGVLFDWKQGEKDNLGFIAQEVENVFPETVEKEKSTGYKSVQYASLVAPLVNAVRQQQLQIETQNKRIKDLEKELEQIKTLLYQQGNVTTLFSHFSQK